MTWTTSDERAFQVLAQKRQRHIDERRDKVVSLVHPVVEGACVGIEAGALPGWPGTRTIAGRIADRLIAAGLQLPGEAPVNPIKALAGFPEAGYEGGGG